MTAAYPAKILRSRPEAQGLYAVDLDVAGTPLGGAHRLPGQFVSVSVGDKSAFFAIASAPDERGAVFELLVKSGSPVADALIAAPAGTEVEVSQVQGKGFPIEQAFGKDVLLFATGSGISAVRSLVHRIGKQRDRFGQVTLFFGVRTPAAFAYASEQKAWEGYRIRVVRTVSQPGSSGWQGLKGYVQAHIADGPLDRAVAFLCGQKAMVQEVTQTLVARGMPKTSIFLNH